MQISIVIPTCNRSDLLEKCLTALAQSCGWPKSEAASARLPALAGCEIIITDDGRDQRSKCMICERFPWAQWTQGPRRGPAANRNNGARQAHGEWLAFLDDDCLPDAQWLGAIRESAASGLYDVIEGKTITPDKVDNPFRQGVENLTGNNYWSCNLAVRRELFLSIGGFDEDFLEAGGEDMEFAFRIRQNQLRVCFAEKMLVQHPVRILRIRDLIWRTRLSRWMLLYWHKTGQALPLSAGTVTVLIHLVSKRFIDLIRTSWHCFSRFERTSWRNTLFWQVWGWITLPVLLPYLCFWEFRFRDLLRQRLGPGVNPHADNYN